MIDLEYDCPLRTAYNLVSRKPNEVPRGYTIYGKDSADLARCKFVITRSTRGFEYCWTRHDLN